jgi:hypothetical protein
VEVSTILHYEIIEKLPAFGGTSGATGWLSEFNFELLE